MNNANISFRKQLKNDSKATRAGQTLTQALVKPGQTSKKNAANFMYWGLLDIPMVILHRHYGKQSQI